MRSAFIVTVAFFALSWRSFGGVDGEISWWEVGGKITWGNSKEEARVGVQHNTSFPGNGIVAIYATATTNYAGHLVHPELEQSFEYRLTRIANGQEVELRAEGKKFGQPLQTNMTRHRRISRELRHLGHPKAEPQQLGFFYVDKCFGVQETGEYELEIRPRLLKWDGQKLTPLQFDPIKVKLHLTANQRR